ncbi:MAG TPA: VOC family protein [Miltoncostaeaceae bacterium]|nr:VOC family protein [Miltoncostaeaceae bacterium]
MSGTAPGTPDALTYGGPSEEELVQFDHVAQQVPDISEAVEWQRRTVPGTTVLHQDATWALVESGGARFAFVLPDQHPSHVAFRVDDAELERLAAEHGAEIATHRDATRSIYLTGPGSLRTEIIAYPPGS